MALDMNYTPTRLVDITTLTEDQWLDWRKKGIGGSDVAAALNMSPYPDVYDEFVEQSESRIFKVVKSAIA